MQKKKKKKKKKKNLEKRRVGVKAVHKDWLHAGREPDLGPDVGVKANVGGKVVDGLVDEAHPGGVFGEVDVEVGGRILKVGRRRLT